MKILIVYHNRTLRKIKNKIIRYSAKALSGNSHYYLMNNNMFWANMQYYHGDYRRYYEGIEYGESKELVP